MTSRLFALTWKELREHGLVLLGLAATLPIGWGLFALIVLAAPTTVTYLETHVSFCRAVLPFAGLALGNRLVVTELHGRTQRFLESLPMPRIEPFVVKWVLGFVVLEGIAFASLVLTAAFATLREPIDAPFLGILAFRTFFYVLFGWCWFFTMGLFGKARVPLYLISILGVILIASTTRLELMHFGPFALAGPEMALERRALPWAAAMESFGLAAAMMGIGAAITTIREGSVQERLAKPMSQRDLAMVGIAVLAVLMIWAGLERPPEPLPYEMAGAHVLHARALPIAIGYGADDATPDAEALMARLERDVGSLQEASGWERLPQMRVVLRRSLDGRTVEPATLAHDDGMLVRANFLGSAEPDLGAISAAVIAGMLDARTRNRARFEPRRWAREGLSTYWAYARELPATRLAQAAWATRVRGVDRARIDHYERLRETLGDRVAASLAATGFDAMERAHPGATVSILRAAFEPGATTDLRATLHERMHPLRAQIRDATSLDDAAIEAAWRAALASYRARADVAAITAALPAVEAHVAITPDASGLPVVEATAHVTGATDGLALSVRHLSIGPFDHVSEDEDMTRESATFGRDGTATVRLVGRYASGDRVLVRVDLEGTALDAPMRLAAERLEVP